MFCVHLFGLVKESKLIKRHGVNNLQKNRVCLFRSLLCNLTFREARQEGCNSEQFSGFSVRTLYSASCVGHLAIDTVTHVLNLIWRHEV